MRLVLVAICFYMLWGYSANAANTTKVNHSIAALVKQEKEKKFSLDLDLSTDSNLRDTTDPEYQANTTLEISPSYKISSQATLNLLVAIEQKHYADQETALTNTTLALNRNPIAIGDGRALKMSVFGIAPTNETERLENTLRGAAGLSTGITQKFTLLKNAGSIAYTLSYAQNFHEFERTNLGAANLQNRIRHTANYIQSLTKKLSLDILARYQTGRTYQNAFRSSFLLVEELNLAIGKDLQLYIAHTNNGDALGANGVDSNISVYDDGTSSFATGIRVSY